MYKYYMDNQICRPEGNIVRRDERTNTQVKRREGRINDVKEDLPEDRRRFLLRRGPNKRKA